MISGANYPNPVFVNGYECWNCTQVDEAKKYIDPADPKAGPFGINAASQPPPVAGTSAQSVRPAPSAGSGGLLDVTV
jgi:hypothetical protein